MWHLTACPWSFERLWSGWPDGKQNKKNREDGQRRQADRKEMTGMKYAVVYDSPTGNTKILAEEIKSCMDGQNGSTEECLYFGEPVPDEGFMEKLSEAEIIFAGFWTDKGDSGAKLAGFLESLHSSRVFLFGTAGFGGSEEYFSRILERVVSHLPSDNTVAGRYMCQGKMPMTVRKRYEAMLEQDPEDKRMKAMIDNFDRALSHPDSADLEKLRSMLSAL